MIKVKAIARTQWDVHKSTWFDCEDCGLYEFRQHICLMRGTIPCDVLFIGEAPGDSEDTLGYPFVGPAGKLLDKWIVDAQTRLPFSYALTNMVACKPCDFRGGPFRKPTKSEMTACEGRLVGFIEIANPKCVVLVGKVASDNFVARGECAYIMEIQHPSYCLRNGGEKSVQSKENSAKLLNGLQERFSNGV